MRVLISLFNGRPVFYHLALWADDQRGADGTLHGFSVHHLLAERLVFLHDLGVGIGQKHERQIKLVGKLFMRSNAVSADAQNNRSDFFIRVFSSRNSQASLVQPGVLSFG